MKFKMWICHYCTAQQPQIVQPWRPLWPALPTPTHSHLLSQYAWLTPDGNTWEAKQHCLNLGGFCHL
jgi:hypothetical protein